MSANLYRDITMNRIEKKMNALVRKYRKEGKSEQWIVSWKRGWYAYGRKG